MQTVQCNCASCDFLVAVVMNLWTKIGNRYFSPVIEPKGGVDVRSDGNERLGAGDTLVQGCSLQDVACPECDAVLGIQCVRTPLNHVLAERQLLLRSSSLVFSDPSNGAKGDLKVARVLSLRDSERPSAADSSPTQAAPGVPFGAGVEESFAADAVDLIRMQADISRIDTAGYQVVSAFENAIGRVEADFESLKGTVQELKRELGDDIKDVKSNLSEAKRTWPDRDAVRKLEDNLRSVNASLAEVRQEVADSKSAMTALRKELDATKSRVAKAERQIASLEGEVAKAKRQIASLEGEVAKASGTAREAQKAVSIGGTEVMALRHELKLMKQEMDQDRATKRAEVNKGSISSRELDILTSNIAKIGNRASQIETMQMEFQLLKSRLQRLESAGDGESDARLPSSLDQDTSMPPGPARRGKRPSDVDGHRVDSSSKRVAFSPNESSTATSGYNTAPEWRDSSPVMDEIKVADASKPRRITKQGTVDGRGARRNRKAPG